jgi:hypothetical protein
MRKFRSDPMGLISDKKKTKKQNKTKKQIKMLDWTVWMVHSTQFGKVLAHAAWTKG